MLHMILIYAGIAIAGIVVGVIGTKFFRTEAAVSETDLRSWRSKLASAITGDEAKVKLEAGNIVKEIETKLHI